MAAYTTTDLLDAINRKSFAPTGQTVFSTSELLLLADEVVKEEVVPSIMAVREEFFVAHKDYAITAGKVSYLIPARAVGMILREVSIISGTAVNSDIPRLEPEEITSTAQGEPRGFYLRGNSVCLYPTPSSGGKTLRLTFHLRPAKHVLPAAAAIIDSIDTETNVITVTSIPDSWTTGNTFDLIRQDGGFEPLDFDLTSTLISGAAITLPSLPDDLRVGDYVALAGETPLIQMPAEYQSAIAQGVAAVILESTSQPGANKAREKFEKQLKKAQDLITPRVHGALRAIRPVNWF